MEALPASIVDDRRDCSGDRGAWALLGAGSLAFGQAKDASAPPAVKAPVEKPADEAAPVPVGQPLSSEEIASAAKLDTFSIPKPGELMAAIDKLGKPG